MRHLVTGSEEGLRQIKDYISDQLQRVLMVSATRPYGVAVVSPLPEESLDDYVETLRRGGIKLINPEGEAVCALHWELIGVLASLSAASLGVLLDELGAILEAVVAVSFRQGIEEGRQRAIDEAHTWLGINKLVNSMRDLENAIYNSNR